MWLVLCSSTDTSALWAYQGLRQLGLAPLELVTVEDLACSSRWEHRLSGNDAQIRITLANGRIIDGAQVRGVLNRLHMPSALAVQQAIPSDQEYAQAEMMAFYLSWLNALPGVVINRPLPLGLCGAWLHPSEWSLHASRAGLRTPVYRQSGRDGELRLDQNKSTAKRLITLRDQVFGGAVPRDVAQACGRLAADVGAQMLGIDLVADAVSQWTFAGAGPSPDLRPGGLPLLRSLAQILTQGAQS